MWAKIMMSSVLLGMLGGVYYKYNQMEKEILNGRAQAEMYKSGISDRDAAIDIMAENVVITEEAHEVELKQTAFEARAKLKKTLIENSMKYDKRKSVEVKSRRFYL